MNELKSTFDLSRWLTAGTILALVLWSTAYSMTAAIHIPTSHLDGAFQTASDSFRIDSGHIPGKNFLPYLGVWYLLALYPAFKLSGSDLSASVFGPYGESTRIFNLQQIHKLISKQTLLPLVILVLAIITASRIKRIEHMLLAWIGVVLLAGGILASIGGHLGSYFRGFCF